MMSFMQKEYTWGGKLDDKNKELKWNPLEEEMEEDEDFIYNHCLFLKQAVLGSEAKEGERNIIEIETTDWVHKEVKQPIVSLKLGLNENAPMDITLIPPVTLRLESGTGPVYLTGTHAMEMEEDEEYTMGDSSVEEMSDFKSPSRKRLARRGTKKSEEGTTEDDEDDEDEDEDEEESMEEDEASPKKKKAKKDEDEKDGEEDEDEEDESEDDEDDDEEDEEEDESSPEKPKKKTKKGKGEGKGEKWTVEKIKKDISDKGGIKKKDKFTSMIKTKYSLTNSKKLTELWTWYKK